MSKLTLTFDNGPVAGASEHILDILRDRQLHATFFVVGAQLEDPGCRKCVERARDEGHVIGNHTLHHAKPLGEYENISDSIEEIAKTQRLLADIECPTQLFRPQGRGKTGPHLLNAATLDYLIDNQLTMVTWNNVPGDWIDPRRDWYDKALQRMAEIDWNVLVLHDHCQIEMLDLLEKFLDHVDDEKIEIRQDFPEDCLPIVQGVLKTDRALICGTP